MDATFSGESVRYRYRLVTVGAVPAAGAAPTVSVPSGQRWRILSVLATLVTSATVANRLAHLRLAEGGAAYADVPAPVVQAAAATVSYSYAPGQAATAVGARQATGMPAAILSPGQSISLATDAIDATDQWTGLTVYAVVEFLQDGPMDVGQAAQAAMADVTEMG